MLAVNLHRLEQKRQTGGGHDRVQRDLIPLKHLHPARLHRSGGHEKAHVGTGPHLVEIDHLFDDVAQRIIVERVEIIGRGEAPQRLKPAVGYAVVEAPVAGHLRPHRPADRTGPPGVGHRLPEISEPGAGALRPVLIHALRRDDRVHRPGGGAGNRFDPDPVVLEQLVQHAPGEGAMTAAALKREVNRFDVTIAAMGMHGCSFRLSLQPMRFQSARKRP